MIVASGEIQMLLLHLNVTGPGFKSRLNPFGFMKGSYPRDMILSVSDDICGIVNNYNGEDYHMHRRRAQKVRVSSKE